MKLIYQKRNKRIKKAVQSANEVLSNPEFFRSISQLPQMDNTPLSSKEIADLLKNHNQPVYSKAFLASLLQN